MRGTRFATGLTLHLRLREQICRFDGDDLFATPAGSAESCSQQGVLELTDVAGPVVSQQTLLGVGCHANSPETQSKASAIQQVTGEKQNVVLAFPQWRDVDRVPVEPVKEIVAEFSTDDFGL